MVYYKYYSSEGVPFDITSLIPSVYSLISREDTVHNDTRPWKTLYVLLLGMNEIAEPWLTAPWSKTYQERQTRSKTATETKADVYTHILGFSGGCTNPETQAR